MLYRLIAAMLIAAPVAAYADGMQAGAGTVVITPQDPVWLAGYASRTAPPEGKEHDLFAKAIAFEDGGGDRSVIITSDLVSVSAELSGRVAAGIADRHGIPRDRVMITSSHTHCGPVMLQRHVAIYGLPEDEAQKVDAYIDVLVEDMLEAVDRAVAELAPASLAWGIGEAGFAGNRRSYTLDGIKNAYNPIGVVDHDVPVLVARDTGGKVKAVLFGYACHNTTQAGQLYSGDYAGFAQIDIEEAFPGATALFVAGCGGDQNPYPRRELGLTERHGKELAGAVIQTVNGDLQPVHGPIHTAYREVPIALTEPPTRNEVEQQTESDNVYVRRRAAHLLGQFEAHGELPAEYPYPVQVWRFSDTLQVTALGGEAVVDYSLRLKYELGRDKHFVIAYANDVPAYIPSLRVLREGGYEGEGAMLYYLMHGPWAPTIEETIVDTVLALTKETGGGAE